MTADCPAVRCPAPSSLEVTTQGVSGIIQSGDLGIGGRDFLERLRQIRAVSVIIEGYLFTEIKRSEHNDR